MGTRLTRFSGFSAVVCGLLTVAFWFLHPGAADPSASHTPVFWEAMQSPRYAAVNGMFIVLIVFNLFALIGVYARLAQAPGNSPFVGFVLAFIGTAVFVGAGTFQAFIAPALAASEMTRYFLEMEGPLLGGPLAIVFMLGGLSFAIGYITLGVVILRTKLFPAPAGIFLILSAPILGLNPLMPLILRTGGSVLYGLAHIWIGLVLYKNAKS